MLGFVSASAVSPLALADGDATLNLGDLLTVAQIATGARNNVAPMPGLLSITSSPPAFYNSGTLPNPMLSFGVVSNYPDATRVNGMDTLSWSIGSPFSSLASSGMAVAGSTAGTQLVANNPGPGNDIFNVGVSIAIANSSGVLAQQPGASQAITVGPASPCAGQPKGTVCQVASGPCDLNDICVGGACVDQGYVPAGTLCGGAPSGVCDLQDTCNGSGNCINNVQTFGTLCKASNGPCDPNDICDGISGACNAVYAPAGFPCGGSNTGCDAPDTCSGTGTCVGNVDPAGTLCFAGSGPCDPDDQCDGLSTSCPATVAPAETSCGGSPGLCEFQDTCFSGICADNGYKPAGTVCRSPAGDCDVAEVCTGLSGGCPADMILPASSISEFTICDEVANNTGSGGRCGTSSCSSNNTTLPSAVGTDCAVADIVTDWNFTRTFQVSRTDYYKVWVRLAKDDDRDGGGEDYACNLDGSPFSVTEAGQAAGTYGVPCGSSLTGNYCWLAAFDNGEVYLSAGAHVVTCSVSIISGGGAEESVGFDGIIVTSDPAYMPSPSEGPNPGCPDDANMNAGLCPSNWGPNRVSSDPYICRPAAGPCDVAETCTGLSVLCPANGLVPDGTACDNGVPPDCDICQSGVCSTSPYFCGDGVVNCGETCDDGPLNGITPCGCQSDCEFSPASNVCRAPADLCDATEYCDGLGACPADLVFPADTPCRADTDGQGCDAVEYCTGLSPGCPADLCEPAGTSCMPGPATCNLSCSCGGMAPSIIITPRKGTSPGHTNGVQGDYNYGMTQGSGGSTDLYAILPNDPLVTGGAQPAGGGVDLVVADVSFTSPLSAGDTVTCEWQSAGTPFDTSDCGTGDSVCVIHAPYPELTGGGLSLNNQQAINPGSSGIGTAVAPDESDTALSDSIRCRINAGPFSSLPVTVRLGFVGVRDKVAPAGSGSVLADFFVYCANGNSQKCGSGPGPDRGISGVRIYFFYNPSVFTGVGPATVPAARSGVANAYNQVAAGTPLVPGPGTCTPTSPPVQCTSIAPGIGQLTGYSIPCNGQVMLYAGSCQLNYSGAIAGTTAWVDPVAISEDFLNFLSDISAFPIRGLDPNFYTPTPSSNVRGYVIFQ